MTYDQKTENCQLSSVKMFRPGLYIMFVSCIAGSLRNLTYSDWTHPYLATIQNFLTKCLTYLDLDYLSWLAWLFTPILVAFLLPAVMVLLLYGNAVFLHVYRLRSKIKEAYAKDFWHGARSALASFWDAQGWIWHGFELHGLENVPDTGPALLVFFHGTLPIDVYYVLAKINLFKNRTVHVVGDRFLFKIPGWRQFLEVFCVSAGSVAGCVEKLRAGQLLILSPGGVREAQFSDHNYRLLWAKRTGFASVAMQAKAPVIPMFTENCREAFRTLPVGRRFFRWIYEKYRIPLLPIYGFFPVKFRTYLGSPLLYPTYDQEVKVEPQNEQLHKVVSCGDTNDCTSASQVCGPWEIREKTKSAVENLIFEHQILPGSISRALLQRIPKLRTIVERKYKKKIIVQNSENSGDTSSDDVPKVE